MKYLHAVFAFIGIPDIEITHAERLALSAAHREAALNTAHATIPAAGGKNPPCGMTLMPGPIHELLYRNLQEVFGEDNAARRQAALEELYTEEIAGSRSWLICP